MWNHLIKINKNFVYAIPVMMLAGFILGATVDISITTSLKYLIVPLTFLMVYPMMVMNIKHLKQGLNSTRQIPRNRLDIVGIERNRRAHFLHGFPDN